jgi:hypothetical protein
MPLIALKQEEAPMTDGTMLAIAAFAIPFLVFAAVLFWAELQTRTPH